MDRDITPEAALQEAGATFHHYEPGADQPRAQVDKALSRRLLRPADLADEPARPYVVKGLIAQGDHVMIMGQPGSGKSALAPYLAYAVAQGRQVLGRRVRAGTVLYLAAEDCHGMRGRVRALLRRYNDAPTFYLFPTAFDLTNPEHLAEITQHVNVIRPVMIVLDTVSRAFPGLRENEAEDMGRVVKVVRDLAAICGAAIVTVHHAAKDAGTTPRGHGCLNGDLDVTMLIEGAGREARTVKLGKNRNGPSDTTFAFRIEVEALGTDGDGDPITAPVVTEVDPQSAAPRRTARLNDQDTVMLREVRDMIGEHGEQTQPGSGMPFVRAVSRQALRAHLIARGWFSEGLLQPAPNGGTGLTRAGYRPENRSLTTLKSKGFLSFTREWVWPL